MCCLTPALERRVVVPQVGSQIAPHEMLYLSEEIHGESAGRSINLGSRVLILIGPLQQGALLGQQMNSEHLHVGISKLPTC